MVRAKFVPSRIIFHYYRIDFSEPSLPLHCILLQNDVIVSIKSSNRNHIEENLKRLLNFSMLTFLLSHDNKCLIRGF